MQETATKMTAAEAAKKLTEEFGYYPTVEKSVTTARMFVDFDNRGNNNWHETIDIPDTSRNWGYKETWTAPLPEGVYPEIIFEYRGDNHVFSYCRCEGIKVTLRQILTAAKELLKTVPECRSKLQAECLMAIAEENVSADKVFTFTRWLGNTNGISVSQYEQKLKAFETCE